MTEQRMVMVVDDDVELRESICEFLEDEGHRVESAPDGAAALARLRAEVEKPALILLDLMMPGMNGWEFREAQLRDATLAQIPVVVMTATREPTGIDVNEVVYKPLKLSRLLEVVGRHVRASDEVKATPRAKAVVPTVQPTTRAGVNEILAGGGQMGARMRAFDWSKSSVGDVGAWPQSLRTAVSICLGSSAPISLYWGSELTTFYNDEFSQLASWATLGKSAKETWPESWGTVSSALERVLRAGESVSLEGFELSPIRGENGRIDGVLQIVDSRDERLAEMTRAVKFSQTFLAIVGHDLRNPLGAISTAATLLEARAESPATTRSAGRILASANRMERMIGQLLDLTRIRVGGGLPIHRAKVDLAEVVRAAVEELELLYKRAISVESSGSVEGTWDGDRLAQLLSNLIGNACQHGTPGEPIRVELDGTKTDVARLEISNRGVIPAEVLPTMFGPLSSDGRTKRHGSSGLGLGLYITKQIVLAHAGTIDVDSSDEQGTSFVVLLPRA